MIAKIPANFLNYFHFACAKFAVFHKLANLFMALALRQGVQRPATPEKVKTNAHSKNMAFVQTKSGFQNRPGLSNKLSGLASGSFSVNFEIDWAGLHANPVYGVF